MNYVVNKWCLGLKALSAYSPLFVPFYVLCLILSIVWLVLCPLSVGLLYDVRCVGAFRVSVRDPPPPSWPPTHTPQGGAFCAPPCFYTGEFQCYIYQHTSDDNDQRLMLPQAAKRARAQAQAR